MKHFWIGTVLLVLLLAVGVWVAGAMGGIHIPIADTLEQAASQALSGDADAGFATARQAHAQWQAHRKGTASVADHTPMEEVDSLFSQMEAFAQAGSIPEFAACCARLSELVRAVGEAHTLTWWNLL